MNSIPYNLTNVIEKKLKNEFYYFSNEVISAITKCLAYPNEHHKYITIISKIHEEARKLIVKIIADVFEELDEQFCNSKNRKNLYHINHRNVGRTITTIFGDVTFKRTYYECKIDGSHHFVLDEALGLPKYDRYDPSVKAIAVSTYSKTNMSIAGQIVGEQLTDLTKLGTNEAINVIPRQSIYNWIKKWMIPKINFGQKPTPETLYVMSDEKFIGCQDKENDIMIKSFVVFEGVEQVSKDRNKLVNKTVINLISSQSWIEFSDILFNMYDSQLVKKIYLLSDGANWLKAGISELKVEPDMDIKHLLCEFHFRQAINHITTDKDEREILIQSFINDSKNDFKKLVEEIKNKNINREETINKKLAYIMNNYNSIKDMLASNIGSSMESHISHYVANQFGSRPKGYSTQRIGDYIDIHNFKNNNFNIYNLYVNTYDNEEVVTINEQELNYSIFERKNDTNVPILSNGQHTSTYQAINNLAHGISI